MCGEIGAGAQKKLLYLARTSTVSPNGMVYGTQADMYVYKSSKLYNIKFKQQVIPPLYSLFWEFPRSREKVAPRTWHCVSNTTTPVYYYIPPTTCNNQELTRTTGRPETSHGASYLSGVIVCVPQLQGTLLLSSKGELRFSEQRMKYTASSLQKSWDWYLKYPHAPPLLVS